MTMKLPNKTATTVYVYVYVGLLNQINKSGCNAKWLIGAHTQCRHIHGWFAGKCLIFRIFFKIFKLFFPILNLLSYCLTSLEQHARRLSDFNFPI